MNVYIYTKENFVTIVTIHTTISNHEKVYPSGLINDSTESISNFTETKIIDRLISKEKIYSAFPCPKLCDSSLGFTCYFISNKCHY